jgi:hypothetical protein
MANKNNYLITSSSGELEFTFTQVPLYILEDNRINANAYRVLAYLKSKKDDWNFYPVDIQKRLGIGRTAYETAIEDLVKYGYIQHKTGYRSTTIKYFFNPANNTDYSGAKPEGMVLGEQAFEERKKQQLAGEQIVVSDKKSFNKETYNKSINDKAKKTSKYKKFNDNVGTFVFLDGEEDE